MDYDEDVYEKPLTDQMLRDRLAFLSLFVTETVDEAIAIQNIFPELSEIFNEMNEYLARPEEVLGMFSEALRILNHNTAVLMVDEYRKKYQEMENNLKKEMKEKMQEIQEMQERENNLKEELDDKDRQINSQEEQHKKDLERIAELEAMLKERGKISKVTVRDSIITIQMWREYKYESCGILENYCYSNTSEV